MAEQLNTGGGEFDPCRYRLRLRDCLLGAQMLFVAFGALVLVPLLTGLNSNVALFTAGVGTLLFQLITRGKVPIFLASSFAFIAPIIYGVETWGMPRTMGAAALHHPGDPGTGHRTLWRHHRHQFRHGQGLSA